MNILISTQTLAPPSVLIYKIVNNDHRKPSLSTGGWFGFQHTISTDDCQKIYYSKTSNQMKLSYNDSKFMILFCGIKAEEDMHQISLLFTHVQALHWTGSSSFMFAPFITDSKLFLTLPSRCGAFETSVNIEVIYLIDIVRTDTGTLHKQWCNGLETPHDQQKRGGESKRGALFPRSSPRSEPVHWEEKLKYFGAGVSVFHTSNDLFYPVHILPFRPCAAW